MLSVLRVLNSAGSSPKKNDNVCLKFERVCPSQMNTKLKLLQHTKHEWESMHKIVDVLYASL